MTDDDAKDTAVLAASDTPFDLEGTEEMDKAALAERLSRLDRSDELLPLSDADTDRLAHDTEQLAAITEKTIQMQGPPGQSPPTQHYVIPESLIEQSRPSIEAAHPPDELETMPLAADAICEFDAIVEPGGSVTVPPHALRRRFKPGVRVQVVLRLLDEE